MKKLLMIALVAASFCTMTTPVYSAPSSISAAEALASPHGQCMEDVLGLFENITATLEMIDDKQSANASAGRLLALNEVRMKLLQRMASLGAPSKALDSKLEELMGKRYENTMKGMACEVQRLVKAQFYGSSALERNLKTLFEK